MNQPLESDSVRLRSQQEAVLKLMLDGKWHNIPDLTRKVTQLLGKPCAQTSVSSKVRALRETRNGAYIVDRDRFSKGGWQFRLRTSAGPDRGLFDDDGWGTREALR